MHFRYYEPSIDRLIIALEGGDNDKSKDWKVMQKQYRTSGGKIMRWFEKIDKNKNTTMPKRATRNSAGYDICASDECVIEPGKKAVIHTNIRVHMNSDEVLLVYPRSSYGIKRDLMLANSVGVIDADYKDEILICYRNMGTKTAYIAHGDRVAQGIFTKYLKTKDDDSTEVRSGGIGSTGK